MFAGLSRVPPIFVPVLFVCVFVILNAILREATPSAPLIDTTNVALPKPTPPPYVDENCPSKPFSFLSNTTTSSSTAPVILLASFPGSGNTFARQMIEFGSGILTGAVYRETYKDFPGRDTANNSVLLVKTHDPQCNMRDLSLWEKSNRKSKVTMQHPIPYHASVLLLREPRDAAYSFFNYMKGGNHTVNPTDNSFTSLDFPIFMAQCSTCWKEHAEHYLHNRVGSNATSMHYNWTDVTGKPVLLVYYEDMKRDPQAELVRIFTFVNWIHQQQNGSSSPVKDVNKAARCAARRTYSRYQRVIKGGVVSTKHALLSMERNKKHVTLHDVFCAKYQSAYWSPQWSKHYEYNCTKPAEISVLEYKRSAPAIDFQTAVIGILSLFGMFALCVLISACLAVRTVNKSS